MDPLVFEPYFRPQIWGERRLERRLGKPLPATGRFGESWEISGHPQHVSRVAEGPLKGTLLTDLWRQHAREIIGTADDAPDRFPLLLKYLDCHEQLSVQVHPTDAVARQLLGDELGKTEAWVVIDAEPTARIFAGLRDGVTRTDLERHLDAGTVAECLHSFVPCAGDCVFLAAGTVHAVGGGVVMAEVQQTSDATFRLFDWNRPGPDGLPRTLHREQSLASINWAAGPVRPIRGVPLSNLPSDVTGEQLVRCAYFHLDRYQVADRFDVPHPGRMSLWMLLDGSATLTRPDGSYRRVFQRGETVLIPASAGRLQWMPTGTEIATLLGVSVPTP